MARSGDGGPATSATLSSPAAIALDATGNLYIADTGHNRIRRVSLDGSISTVAGNGSASGALGDGGPATSASLSLPTGIALDAQGNLYIADSGHARIRVVSSGIVTTVAGNGTTAYSGDGGLATLSGVGSTPGYIVPSVVVYAPEGLALDGNGALYIADQAHGRVRVLTADGNINTIAGNGPGNGSTGDNGPATSAGLGCTCGVALGAGGKVYIADGYSIRLLTPTGTAVYPGPSFEVNGVVNASAFGTAPNWLWVPGSRSMDLTSRLIRALGQAPISLGITPAHRSTEHW